MDRRHLLAMLGGITVAWPLAASAQKVGKVYRIGILEAIPAAQNAANLDALLKGLRDFGYVEGRNLIIEYRSADGRAELFPDLASELMRGGDYFQHRVETIVGLVARNRLPAAYPARESINHPVHVREDSRDFGPAQARRMALAIDDDRAFNPVAKSQRRAGVAELRGRGRRFRATHLVTPHKVERPASEEAIREIHAHHRYSLRRAGCTSGG